MWDSKEICVIQGLSTGVSVMRIAPCCSSANLFGTNTLSRLIDETFVEQVQCIGTRSCEKVTQWRFGELANW